MHSFDFRSVYEGVKRVTKEADFVLFNGTEHSKEAALLIVEAKKTGRPLTEDVAGQARAYAMWLTTPYYMVTNGDEIHVYLFRGAVSPDVMLMNFKRGEMRQNWSMLFETLNKAAVVKRKKELNEMLTPDARSSGG
jgi:type I site-specific restriction endonuclease